MAFIALLLQAGPLHRRPKGASTAPPACSLGGTSLSGSPTAAGTLTGHLPVVTCVSRTVLCLNERTSQQSWALGPYTHVLRFERYALIQPKVILCALRSSCGWQMLRFHGQVCSCSVCALSRLLCCRPNAEAECCSSMNQRSRTQKILNAFRSRSS